MPPGGGSFAARATGALECGERPTGDSADQRPGFHRSKELPSMSEFQTPGVYVKEIATLPPSVAEVSTAIPAFFGCTETGSGIARVNTLLEFEERFGKAHAKSFTVEATLDAATNEYKVTVARTTPTTTSFEYRLYEAVSLYFMNGGGPCYIVSVGNHTKVPVVKDFTDAFNALEKEDEPTLIVLTDAIGLSKSDYHTVCQKALAHCQSLGDRFAILDVYEDQVVAEGTVADPVGAFRTGIGTTGLNYGAAYFPYVTTTLVDHYTTASVSVKIGTAEAKTLKDIESSHSGLYHQIKARLSQWRIVMPPSAAIAGVYASVDRTRGVWKAPANVSLAGVIAPVIKITDAAQANYNIDPTSGKSINAIRAFPGKGTLVWGARTLAGNDNEWRYVPVRRLFNLIEESTRKATEFAVFEPNHETTWLRVKGMIDSYLYGLWERGALAGSTPAQAYFVNIGLGKTMTTQDILEGRMNVDIGIAAVRPAEFVVLRFTHKLQQA
jgi:phage tail sheath protein FI